jgi:hypothetical protein
MRCYHIILGGSPGFLSLNLDEISIGVCFYVPHFVRYRSGGSVRCLGLTFVNTHQSHAERHKLKT